MKANLIFLLLTSSFLKLIAEEIKNCEKFATGSIDYCLQCSESYYNQYEPGIRGVPFPSVACVPKNQNLLELEIFVSSNVCPMDSACNGSQDYPYDNLIYALDFANNKTRMHLHAEVKFYLLGTEIFILEKDLKIASKIYFHRSLVSISFYPLYCSFKNISACRGQGETVTINIKSNQIIFFVSHFLSLKNILFKGIDMPLEMAYYSECYSNKISCCDYENKEKISSYELNFCNLSLIPNNFNTSKYSYGMFTSEFLSISKNITGSPFPKILIENCKFESLTTLFPTKDPRFSSFIQIRGSLANVTITNITLLNCSIFEGVVNQILTPKSIDNSSLSPAIFISNSTITNYKGIYYRDAPYNIINIRNFQGDIVIDTIYLLISRSFFCFFLNLSNINANIQLKNIYYADNKNMNFILCKFCKTIIFEEVIMIKSSSNLTGGNSLIDIKYSENVIINYVTIYNFLFSRNRGQPYAISVISTEKTAILKNIQIEKIDQLTISFYYSVVKLQDFILRDMFTDYRLLNFVACLPILDKLILSNIDIYLYDRALISLRSDRLKVNFILQVFDSIFLNILFVNLEYYSGVISWPEYTKTDLIFMRNISIYNCTHYSNYVWVVFFLEKIFSKIHLENILFSLHKRGKNALLHLLQDVEEVKLDKILFRNNPRLDFNLLRIICSKCIFSLSNLEVQGASFTYACFLFRTNSGFFENFTFSEISGILPSPDIYGKYSFDQGLIIFGGIQYLLIKNWHFSSTQTFKFTPSRFFYFSENYYIYMLNISFLIPENFVIPPETHILTSYHTSIMKIEGLVARNFFCQKSYYGYTFYEGGVISFFHSRTFLKENSSEAQVYLKDFSIENCKFCMNGVVAIINIAFVTLNNITIFYADNLNGGALAIYYGKEILIENFNAQNCSASHYGGVLFISGTLTSIIKNSFFNLTIAYLGGGIFSKNVSSIYLINLTCINSRSLLDGGVLYGLDSNIALEGGTASKFLALRDGGYSFIKRGSAKFFNNFEAASGAAEKGGFLFAYEAREITFQNLVIRNSSGKDKGITFFLEESEKLLSENVTLKDIKSESGFGNIYMSIRTKYCFYEIINVVCLRVSMLSAAFIYLENELTYKRSFKIFIKNILISEAHGSIAVLKSSYLSDAHLFFLENITVSDFKSTPIQEDSGTTFNEGFIFYNTYSFLKNIFLMSFSINTNCLSVLYSNFFLDHLFFKVKPDTYSEANARCLINLYNSKATILNMHFLGEKTTNLAIISSDKSWLLFKNGLTFNCHAYLTACFLFKKSSVQIGYSSFVENKGFSSGVLSFENSLLTLEKSKFKNNTGIDDQNRESKSTFVSSIAIVGSSDMEISIISYCQFIEINVGTIIFLSRSSLNLTSCFFFAESNGNISRPLKAIWSISSNVKIFRTNFSCFGSINGGTIKFEHRTNQAKFFSMEESRIMNSTSEYGGAFSLIGVIKVYIFRTVFSYNKALKNARGEYGNFGVGLFISTCNPNSSFILLSNQFIENYAENGIALIFSNIRIVKTNDNQKVEVLENIFIKNTDGIGYPGNISSFPITAKLFVNINTSFLSLSYYNNITPTLDQVHNQYINHSLFESTDPSITKSFSQFINIKNDKIHPIIFKSGQPFDLIFLLVDDLGQEFILPVDRSSKAIITDSSKDKLHFFLISNKQSNNYNALLYFKNLLIKADLNRSFELELNLYLNQEYIYPEDRKFVLVDPQSLIFYTRVCEIGDIIIEGDSTCLKCPQGKFSIVDPMEQYNTSYYNIKCMNCPINAVCLGGSIIIPKKVFWRSSNSSTLIIECLSKFSCLGFNDGYLKNEEFIHGRCLEHSFGPLCYMCEYGYGRFSKKGVCRICANEIESYIKLAILVVLFVNYSLIQIRLTFVQNKTSSAGILLKIIVTHFHQLSLISLVDLGWSPDFNVLFSFQEIFSFLTEDLLPLECFLQKFEYNIYIQKVIATNIYPIVLSIIIIFCWILFLILVPKQNHFSKARRTIEITKVAFLIVIVLLFPEVISKCLSLFTCLPIDNTSSPKKILLYSPEVICWGEDHILYLKSVAIPGLIGWGLIAPSIIAINLFKNRRQIQELIDDGNGTSSMLKIVLKNNSEIGNFRRKAIILKFLFKGYSSKYFYWELLMFLKKFLLISIGCISDLFPSKIRGVILMVLIIFFLLAHIRFQPFESRNLNKLELFSLLITFLTANIGILMFSLDLKIVSMTLLIIVICSHAIFLLFWVYLFLKEVKASSSFIKFIGALKKRRKRKNAGSQKILPSRSVLVFMNPNGLD